MGWRGPHGGIGLRIYVQAHRSGFLKAQPLRVYLYTVTNCFNSVTYIILGVD